jgi:hypothetical protein
MSRLLPPVILILVWILLCIVTAGCSTPAVPTPGNGSIQVNSVPPGAEIWLDGEFRATTPGTISGVPAGHHWADIRMGGYENVSYPVTVTNGGLAGITATLVSLPKTLPVTRMPTPLPSVNLPQIRVDGYWTYPQGRSSTENPVPLVVHTEAFNIGTAGAREVNVSANFYYNGRMVCWNTVYLGTLAAGGHVSRDTMVTCPLPFPRSDADLEVRFENAVIVR